MNISVIVPSALKRRPDGELWLRHALDSVSRQTLPPAEVLVGVDPGRGVIPVGYDLPVRWVEGDRPGHQAACNAAAKVAAGPLLAFLEDDDAWRPEHLQVMAAALVRHAVDFATASQLEVTPDGTPLREFHFATMSGWLITRGAWLRTGGVDGRWRIHHDNEFLCRFHARHDTEALREGRRVRLAQMGADRGHGWLREIANRCDVWSGLERLTVLRTRNDAGVLGGCRADPAAERRSQDEYAALRVLYGTHGW